MKNYLWCMFANIKNGNLTKRKFIVQRKKRICESFLKILWNEGLILGYVVTLENPNILKIFLKYKKNKPVLNSIKLVSKPGRKIYYSAEEISKLDSNKYFIIFSTNQGLQSLIKCKKLKIGGEPFIIIN
jgi:small subunit ribosomal protein S8